MCAPRLRVLGTHRPRRGGRRVRGTRDADLGLVEFHLAELGAERDLGGIPANTDADDAFRVSHARRVEYIPSRAGRPTQEGFKYRVKIRRLQPPGIGTDIARGDAERPAERDAKVGKIPADTRALRNGV